MSAEKPITAVDENTSCFLYTVLWTMPEADGGVVIPASALSSASYVLKNQKDSSVIETNADCSSSINESGVFNHLLTAAKNAIVSKEKRNLTSEVHILILTVIASVAAVTYNLEKEFWIRVDVNRYNG
jgi:hypothetical protein